MHVNPEILSLIHGAFDRALRDGEVAQAKTIANEIERLAGDLKTRLKEATRVKPCSPEEARKIMGEKDFRGAEV